MYYMDKLVAALLIVVIICIASVVVLAWADWLKYGRLSEVKAEVKTEQR